MKPPCGPSITLLVEKAALLGHSQGITFWSLTAQGCYVKVY